MRKTIILFLITLISFFPPVSIYFAVREAKNLQMNEQQEILDERVFSDLQQLRRVSDDANYLIRSHTAISQVLRRENSGWLKNLNKSDFKEYLSREISGIIKNAGFRCEYEFIRLDNHGRFVEAIHFGDDLGLQKITGAYKAEKENPKNLPPWQRYYMNVVPELVNNNITKIVIRRPGTSITLSGEKIFPQLLVFSLGDHSEQSLQQNLMIRIKRFPTRSYGLGAICGSPSVGIFNHFFAGQSSLRQTITNAAAKTHNDRLKADFPGYNIYFSEFDMLKKCRYFAAVPVKAGNLPSSTTQSMLQIFVWLLSCIVFKTLAEKMLLGRGPEISFKVMLPAIFIFLVIQPVFASACLLGEYFRLSFAVEKNRVTDRLVDELSDLDRNSLDAGTRTLNVARGLNSIEHIASYTGRAYSGDDTEMARSLLNEISRKNQGRLFSSLWVGRGEKSIVGIRWQPEQAFGPERVDNLVAELFKTRFSEMLHRRQNLFGVTAEAQISESRLDRELKNEYSRDFFLKIFGADAFFRFRQSMSFRIDIIANYRREQVLTGPIDYKGRPWAFAAWYVERDSANLLLDGSNFIIDSDSPRVAIFGDEHSFQGVRFSAREIANRHPELARVAEASHLTNTSNGSIQITPDRTLISLAIPAMYSNFTLAGSEVMSSFPVFRQQLAKRLMMLVALVVLTGIVLAFAGALYFVWPLQELTTATRQIAAGDFTTRIQANHPDEFAALATSFNNMANGLEEGALLKSFVTDSVRREVAGAENVSLAERAETTGASIVFAAICGFSDYQKTHGAQEVFELLQVLLQASDKATREFGGEIDKMIEDKIMIVFEHRGADAHRCPEMAIRAAARIHDLVNLETGMRVAVGVNTGVTVAGIMGAEQVRLSRTVVGDPVNLASRLACEALKRNGGIIISGQLLEHLSRDFIARKLPVSTVKGKTQSIEAFEISVKERSA